MKYLKGFYKKNRSTHRVNLPNFDCKSNFYHWIKHRFDFWYFFSAITIHHCILNTVQTSICIIYLLYLFIILHTALVNKTAVIKSFPLPLSLLYSINGLITSNS